MTAPAGGAPGAPAWPRRPCRQAPRQEREHDRIRLGRHPSPLWLRGRRGRTPLPREAPGRRLRLGRRHDPLRRPGHGRAALPADHHGEGAQGASQPRRHLLLPGRDQLQACRRGVVRGPRRSGGSPRGGGAHARATARAPDRGGASAGLAPAGARPRRLVRRPRRLARRARPRRQDGRRGLSARHQPAHRLPADAAAGRAPDAVPRRSDRHGEARQGRTAAAGREALFGPSRARVERSEIPSALRRAHHARPRPHAHDL